ncbi:hypothetical protein FKW77_009843 [Venturia effusa]|uniref:Uncharacterized protein n=1 Tax=Venturia effusa TaxID=50376 RepID=A0A517KXF6_9PEZI|nr:hypothetical protein FKW77_009843 [Venturia effusa]
MCFPFPPRKGVRSASPALELNLNPNISTSSSSYNEIVKQARFPLGPATAAAQKPELHQTRSIRRAPVTPKASDDQTQTPYYHLQNAHDRQVLDDANSADGQFRLKQREQRLVVQHGISIRDFAFERIPKRTGLADGEVGREPRTKAEGKRKEEGNGEKMLGRDLRRADSITSSSISGAPSFCSLDIQQQQLVLDAWRTSEGMDSVDA